MERLSTSRDTAENKLLILYVLSKLSIEIGSIELTNFVLEQRLMQFLAFQQRIHELVVTNHVSSVIIDGKTYYEITGDGEDLLSDMHGMLPQTEKNRVDRTIRMLRQHTINERSVTASYMPEDEYNGVVRIGLSEGDLSVLTLEIATASTEEARTICRNWKAHAAEIYSGIVDLLLETAFEDASEQNGNEDVDEVPEEDADEDAEEDAEENAYENAESNFVGGAVEPGSDQVIQDKEE